MMSDLGVQVTILEALPKILPGCDADVANVVVRSFQKRGIQIRTGVPVTGHEPQGDGGTIVRFGEGEEVRVDQVVVSVGRRPYADLLGLDGTAVQVDRGFVQVDEWCRTAEPGVYAIGDLIATPQLAHVGFAEAIMVVKDILGESPVPVDYGEGAVGDLLPPRGRVRGLLRRGGEGGGLRRRDVEASVPRQQPRADHRRDRGAREDHRREAAPTEAPAPILGVHMVGPWVTEQLGAGYLAVNWEATVDEVAHFIQPHPSLSELFGESVLAMTGRSLHG